MSFPGWSYPPPYGARSDSGPHELEALQTDVMRFMAILGFCLMAIFALVQSLPTGRSDARPSLENPLQLAQEVEQLQQQAQQARRQLAELENRLANARIENQQAVAESIKARQKLEQTVVQADQVAREREQIVQRAQSAEKAFDMISRRLSQAETALDARGQQLIELERQIQAGEHTLAKLRRDLASQRRALAKTEARLAAIKQTLNEQKQAAVEKKVSESTVQKQSTKPVAKQQPARPTRQGFSLHFASDEALAALVKARKVQFYAMLGSRAWELQYIGGTPRFVPSSKPRSFYEMHTHTVPRGYLNAMRKTATVFDMERVTWGTTLPAPTQNQIKRLMTQHDGGDLVIQPEGKVEIAF